MGKQSKQDKQQKADKAKKLLEQKKKAASNQTTIRK